MYDQHEGAIGGADANNAGGMQIDDEDEKEDKEHHDIEGTGMEIDDEEDDIRAEASVVA